MTAFENFRKELNLRDIGGYATKDGRTVKKGLIYRSAELCLFSEEELAQLQTLGIRTIVDFRSKKGAEKRPDPPMAGARYIHEAAAFQNILDDLNSPKSVADLLFDSDQKGNLLDRLTSTYTASLAFTNDAYQTLFDCICKEEVPLLFHCANGKDRTGVAAMLIHLLLGVSPEDAKKDYLMTNESRKLAIDQLKENYKFWAERSGNVETLVEMLAGVIPESADMLITEIPERYGTYENFFEKEYGIDQLTLEKIRNYYLE